MPRAPVRPSRVGDDGGHLDRRRRHQPDLAAHPQVLLGQGLGPRPDPGFNHFVIDFFAERLDVLNGDTGGEGQGGVADGVDVVHVFPAQHEHELLPGETGGLRNGERPALVHLAGHMEQAGAPHQGVVDVEERGFAVLRCCNRLGDHSDVLLFGHATSLVNAGAAFPPPGRAAAPDVRPSRVDARTRRPGYRGAMPNPDVVLCHQS